MDSEDSVDEDCASTNPRHMVRSSLREASLNSLLKITTLQKQIAQIRLNLGKKEKKIDTFRRKAKEELIVGKRLGPAHMSTNAVSDIVSFITLLEEQNRDLRALSFIPIEIDKLKSELSQANLRKKSFDAAYQCLPDTCAGEVSLPAEVDSLRLEVTALQKRLDEETAARTHLLQTVVPRLEQEKQDLEREISKLRSELSLSKAKVDISLFSFQDNDHFNRAEDSPKRCVTSASPASKKEQTSPRSAKGSPRPLSKLKGPVLKARGYSPTFKRVLKAKRFPKAKSQRTTPEPLLTASPY